MIRVKLLKVSLTTYLLISQVRAWYNTSHLAECDLAKKWDVTQTAAQVKSSKTNISGHFSPAD